MPKHAAKKVPNANPKKANGPVTTTTVKKNGMGKRARKNRKK